MRAVGRQPGSRKACLPMSRLPKLVSVRPSVCQAVSQSISRPAFDLGSLLLLTHRSDEGDSQSAGLAGRTEEQGV
jgi:hypothetical protein